MRAGGELIILISEAAHQFASFRLQSPVLVTALFPVGEIGFTDGLAGELGGQKFLCLGARVLSHSTS